MCENDPNFLPSFEFKSLKIPVGLRLKTYNDANRECLNRVYEGNVECINDNNNLNLIAATKIEMKNKKKRHHLKKNK